MMGYLFEFLRENPVGLLFVILGSGYLIGKPKIWCFELGPVTGAMTSGAALSVVNSAARSSAPDLGHTRAYAFANVVLTLAGTLIVRL
jgi:uncharacterized transporter YbjL